MTDPISSSTTIAAAAAAAGAAELPGFAQALAVRQAQASSLQQPTAAQLHAAATALTQYAQSLQTSLHFQVDRITGQLVVSVIDTQNNQVLMQVPGQEALAIAQSLEQLHPNLMSKTA